MTLPPAIILVRPQLGENIGAAARAMANFGLTDLRIVAPRNGWPNPRAYDMAANATNLLDAAKLYDTTQEAVADLTRIYATTGRERDLPKPVLNPSELGATLHAENEASGILFGPERTGLHNDDLALTDALINIPTAPGYTSLNLSQSVVVLAYSWLIASPTLPSSPLSLSSSGLTRGSIEQNSSRAQGALMDPRVKPEDDKSATKAEVQGFFDHLEGYLDASDFFKTPQKKEKMWHNLRAFFTRAAPSSQEISTLRGMIRSLKEGK